MRCIVDSRETSKKILRNLKHSDLEFMIDKLDAGDYYIPPVLIERKTPSDLISSIKQGRLFDQIGRMKSFEDSIPLILVEGSLAWIQKKRGFPVSSVNSTFNSIIFDWDVPIVPSPNEYWTVNFFERLAKKFTEKKKKIRPVRVKEKALTLEEEQRYIIEGLPGIGPRKSKELLREFGTVKSVMNKSRKDLEKIRGIGKKLSKRIYRTVNSEFKD